MFVYLSSSLDDGVQYHIPPVAIEIKPQSYNEDGALPCASTGYFLESVDSVSDSKQWASSGVTLLSSVDTVVPKNPYQCSVCDLEFPYMISLKRHMIKHKRRDNGVSGYRCCFCEVTVPSDTLLRMHLIAHFSLSNSRDDLPIKIRNSIGNCRRRKARERNSTRKPCSICRRMITQNYMPQHMTMMHNVGGSRASVKRKRPTGPRPYKACRICGKLCSDLYKHRRVHRKKTRTSPKTTCTVCGVKVVDMRKHLQVHEIRDGKRTRMRPCEVCGKEVSDMYKHRKTHLKQTPNHMQVLVHEVRGGKRRRNWLRPCEICGKVVADLYKHRKTHSKERSKSKSCDVCGKVVVDLYRHRKIHSGKARLLRSCSHCGKLVVDMYKHMLIHRGDELPPQLCTICGKRVKHLPRHRETHTGIRRRQQPCEICGKVVTDIRVHRQTHEERGHNHKCFHCGKYYATSASLKEHLSIHSNQRNYVCAECGKRFRSKTALSGHMWMHSAEPRYQCTVCGKAFRWHLTYKGHLLKHGIGVNRTHNCTFCSKYFAQAYLLRNHMRMHTGEKPYMCSKCGHRFAHASSLLTHQKCTHSEEMRSSCPECGKMIRVVRMLEHMRIVHGGILHECPHCEMEFRQRDWLDWHIQSHGRAEPFVCDDCSDRKDVPLLDQSGEFPGI